MTKIRENSLPLGMLSLSIGIIIGRFTNFTYSDFSISAFLEGVFIGLSIVMNLFYLATRSKK
jgi:Na+-translocating ferredoxin:NAD+ oxidoreductase RnfE subunit